MNGCESRGTLYIHKNTADSRPVSMNPHRRCWPSSKLPSGSNFKASPVTIQRSAMIFRAYLCTVDWVIKRLSTVEPFSHPNAMSTVTSTYSIFNTGRSAIFFITIGNILLCWFYCFEWSAFYAYFQDFFEPLKLPFGFAVRVTSNPSMPIQWADQRPHIPVL